MTKPNSNSNNMFTKTIYTSTKLNRERETEREGERKRCERSLRILCKSGDSCYWTRSSRSRSQRCYRHAFVFYMVEVLSTPSENSNAQ